jgi:hypothetical protein
MTAHRRDVPLDLLEKAIHKYHFNAKYLFSGEGTPVMLSAEDDGLIVRQLQIVTDGQGKERIVHVPYPAQAGYGKAHDDPAFIGELPSYILPDPQFLSGSYRSFEIAGSSMEPTWRPGDVVIASFIEPRYWSQAIRNGHIMVVVTQQDVLLKRVINKLKSDGTLECLSDNEEYQPFIVTGEEIREIWKPRMRLTAHLEPDTTTVHARQISEQLQRQHELLTDLRQQLQIETAT